MREMLKLSTNTLNPKLKYSSKCYITTASIHASTALALQD